MPEFDPYDLQARELNSYRPVGTPGSLDTAQAVVNPDGSLIGSGGGGTSNVNLIEVGGAPVALGQTVAASSIPAVLASDQTLPLPANAAQETGGNLDSIQTNTANTEFYVQAHLPSIDNNTTQITTDTGNIATSTAASSSSLMEIALDTDNLPPMKSDLDSIVTNTTGLATQATLSEIALDTDNLATILANQTNGSQTTQVSSSALPAGAATSANQATEISDLGSIVTNTTGLATQSTLAEIATDTDNLATILANQTNGTQKALNTAQLVPVAFDTIQVTAVDGSDRPTTILYKTGGLAGTTVATLTIVYDGSGNFQSVVRT